MLITEALATTHDTLALWWQLLHSQNHAKNIVFITIHAKEQHVCGIQLPDSIEPRSFDLMHQGPFMVL